MFLFLFISLRNIIFALPMPEKLFISDNIVDRILMSNVKNSSSHLHESVQALQTAIKILFPTEGTNVSIDRQALIIGCLINRGKKNEKPRRECKGLHEKYDKNVFYEFDDKSLNDHLPIHIEHIDVARVDKPINDTVEEIRRLIANDNETNGRKIHLDTMLASQNENKKGVFQWLLDKYRTSKTTTTTTIMQVSQLQPHMYSMNEQTNDADFSIPDQQSTYPV